MFRAASLSVLRKDRGQSLVEFAISVFLLVMLLLGVVEIGRMVLVYTTISNAARVGLRYAIVNGADASQPPSPTVTQVVKNYLAGAPMTSGNATVNVCYGAVSTCSASSGSAATAVVGTQVTVQVSYVYDPLTSYFRGLGVTLGSRSQGVITF